MLALGLYLGFVALTIAVARRRFRIRAERLARERQRRERVPGAIWDLDAWEEEPDDGPGARDGRPDG